MRMRRHVLAVALTAGMLVPTAVTTTVAWAGPAAGPAASPSAPQTSKPARTPQPAKPVKPAKVSFTASGFVTAVDAAAGTVTVAAKGGTKDVRGRIVRILLPAGARIVVDDAPAAPDAIRAGFRITVHGTRVGTVHTAAKVQASSPEPETTPTPVPTPPAPDQSPDV